MFPILYLLIFSYFFSTLLVSHQIQLSYYIQLICIYWSFEVSNTYKVQFVFSKSIKPPDNAKVTGTENISNMLSTIHAKSFAFTLLKYLL